MVIILNIIRFNFDFAPFWEGYTLEHGIHDLLDSFIDSFRK